MSTETLNGHAVPSGVTEEVKVDIESPETPAEEKTVITPEADDTEGDIFLDCLSSLVIYSSGSQSGVWGSLVVCKA